MKKLLALSLVALAATVATADEAWFQYSVFSPGDLLLPWARNDVYGLRLNMPYGNNKAREKNPSVGNIYGLDLGIVDLVGGSMKGVQLGCWNAVDAGETMGLQLGVLANRTKDVYGVQLGGIVNWNDNLAYGLQIAPLNYDSEFVGFQAGIVDWMVGNMTGGSVALANVAVNEFTGVAIGAFNYSVGKVVGAQIGAFNVVDGPTEGLQLGVINASQHHTGVQIGLVNLNATGSIVFLPVINVNFNH